MIKELFAFSLLLALSCQKQGNPSSGEVHVTGVTLDRTELELPLYGSLSAALSPTVTPSDATDKRVVWLSDNEASVRVSSDGIVSARSRGTANVTVMTVDGAKTASCAVTVGTGFKPIISLSLDEQSIVLDKGASRKLTVTMKPTEPSNPKILWESSNPSVASVVDGVVTAVAEGSAVISAIPDEDPSKKAACTVKVRDGSAYPAGVTVNLNRAEQYCVAEIDFAANPRLCFSVCFHDNGEQLAGHFAEFTSTHPDCGEPIIMTNADLFFDWEGHRYSCNMAMTGGVIKRYPCFEDNGWYPTRSTLGRNADGSFEINWVRGTRDCSELYAYPDAYPYASAEAADNNATGRRWWWPVEAVGGGPRLVKEGKNVCLTYVESEKMRFSGYDNPTTYKSQHVAWGLKADGKLVILCENNLTLYQTAERMIELGCIDAIHFDNGGSAEMLGRNAEVLMKQTDAVERRIVSAICISEK